MWHFVDIPLGTYGIRVSRIIWMAPNVIYGLIKNKVNYLTEKNR